MYLSTLPIDQAMGIFDRISKKTSARNTIVSGAMFERALLEIRETGFALDDQKWFDEVIGALVPIFNREQHTDLNPRSFKTFLTSQDSL
ncbi:MAG: hypothetical protein HN984_04315 [Marinovum sp.]|nr:hypothetical protein [Marinovum sp.]